MKTVKSKTKIGITLNSIGALLVLFLGTLPYFEVYKWYIIAIGLVCSAIGITLIIMQHIEDKETKKLYPAFISGGLILTMVVVYLLMFNNGII